MKDIFRQVYNRNTTYVKYAYATKNFKLRVNVLCNLYFPKYFVMTSIIHCDRSVIILCKSKFKE